LYGGNNVVSIALEKQRLSTAAEVWMRSARIG